MRLLHEYAVDPGVICDWRSLRDLSDKVGVPKGRVIARFPKSWFRDIYDRFATSRVQDARFEIALRRLERAVLPTGRPNKLDKPSWLESAVHLHRQRPFRAIITNEPLNKDDCLVALDDLAEDHPKWSCDTELPLPRRSDAWINAIGLLLLACSELMFIDPHFKPWEGRYQRTLQALCGTATKDNPRISSVEYHVEKSQDWEVAYFEGSCQKELPILIPAGLEMRIFIWTCNLGGQDFHARYLLTNHGGVRFEQGLDDNRNANSNTDVSLLDEGLYKRRRTDFTKGHPDCAFTIVHTFIVIGCRPRAG